MLKKSKRLAVVGPDCVACGTCIQACPLGAITIIKGIIAQVDASKCVGCGKCSLACPASVITISRREKGVEANESETVA
ncbi:MAG: 4Fe-4S binding protein [Firmicutes bacterium]|nr:4Fe-4S binding protein [Bacillota bacterium]